MAGKTFYFELSFLLLVAVGHLMASDKVIDPEVLANMSIPRDAFRHNYTLENCQEWDTWEPLNEAREILNYYRSGYDNDGNVVYISEYGKLSYRKLAEKSDEIIQDFWKYYELIMLRLEYDARNHDGVVMLYDFEGFTLANYASAEALKFSLKMFTSLAHLNTVIKYGFIVNVNYAGESFLQLTKPFLGDALNKFQIGGTRSDKWKPKLLREIPAIHLPSKYGGAASWQALSNRVCEE